MEVNDRIKKKLAVLEIDYASLKPRTLNYLVSIEKYVCSRLQERDDAFDKLRASRFTISDIAKHIKCSRTTLYNNDQLLKRYIDYSLHEFDDGYILNEIDGLKSSNSLLQQRLALMEARDVDIEILKHENRALKEQLRDRQADITRLRANMENLSKQLSKIKASTQEKR